MGRLLRELLVRRSSPEPPTCQVDPLITHVGARLQLSNAELQEAEEAFRRAQREAQPVILRRNAIVTDRERR